MRRSVDFWYFRISLKAWCPGRNFLAVFAANCGKWIQGQNQNQPKNRKLFWFKKAATSLGAFLATGGFLPPCNCYHLWGGKLTGGHDSQIKSILATFTAAVDFLATCFKGGAGALLFFTGVGCFLRSAFCPPSTSSLSSLSSSSLLLPSPSFWCCGATASSCSSLLPPRLLARKPDDVEEPEVSLSSLKADLLNSLAETLSNQSY